MMYVHKMHMLLKVAMMMFMCNHNTPLHNKNIISNKLLCKGQPNVHSYICNNGLTTFTLYNILDTCTRNILLYHNINNASHGNTTIKNFLIQNSDMQICLCHSDIQHVLTNTSKYIDYEMFFGSFEKALNNKNKHFSKVLGLYKISFYKSIF